METKICTKCGEEKDISEYNKCKKSKDGLNWRCKNCVNEYHRLRNSNPEIKEKLKLQRKSPKWSEYYRLYRENPDNKEKEKERKQSDKYKEYSKQHNKSESHKISRKKYNSSPHGIQKAKELNATPHAKEVRKIYRTTPAGKISSRRKEHKRRLSEISTECTLTLLQWEKILETQGNKCAICGKRFCKSRPPTQDHIVPVSQGGGLTFENVQALCKSCNSAKSDKLDHSKLVTWIK